MAANVDEYIRYMPGVQKYRTLLNGLNLTWENIEINAEMNCPTEAKTILPTMASTREGYSRLEVQPIENLVQEELKKVVQEITSKASGEGGRRNRHRLRLRTTVQWLPEVQEQRRLRQRHHPLEHSPSNR